MSTKTDKRPSETATSFRMRLDSVCGPSMMSHGWESFPNFGELFKESRRVAEMDGYELVGRSSNKHYRQTGHYRMVLRSIMWWGQGRPAHVVMHIIMK